MHYCACSISWHLAWHSGISISINKRIYSWRHCWSGIRHLQLAPRQSMDNYPASHNMPTSGSHRQPTTPRLSKAFGMMLIRLPPAPCCSVQLFLLLALLMALFTLTSSAEVVALGLYEDYLRRHRWMYGAALLALATYAAHRAFSLVGDMVLQCAWDCVLAPVLHHSMPTGCTACPAVRCM